MFAKIKNPCLLNRLISSTAIAAKEKQLSTLVRIAYKSTFANNVQVNYILKVNLFIINMKKFQ